MPVTRRTAVCAAAAALAPLTCLPGCAHDAADPAAQDAHAAQIDAGAASRDAGPQLASDAALAEDASLPRDALDATVRPDGGISVDAADAAPIADAASILDAAGSTAVCGSADEEQVVPLRCPDGQIIDHVAFASYGTPSGTCGDFAAGSCNAATSQAVVDDLCLGRESCNVPATNGSFGDPCSKTVKRLAIEARCVLGVPTHVPKPFKGVANSPCDARRALDVSWYYNWGQTENEPCSDGSGGEFVPMIWGHPGGEQTASSIASSVASFVAQGYTHVLGFNEPDNPDQANIPVDTAIALWPAFDNAQIDVVSPATAANVNPGQAWFTDFMAKLTDDPTLRADVLAIHWYGWNAGSCDAKASQLESYIKWAEGFAGGRAIWITEWGCLNQSAPDDASVLAFFQGALAVFARHPRIERYAWYPWASHCSLVNGDGQLTSLGEAYAAAPATR